MRVNKYFLSVVFLSAVLFFSINSVQAACRRTIFGQSGSCCDNTLNEQQCNAITEGSHVWIDCSELSACTATPSATTSTTNASALTTSPAHTPAQTPGNPALNSLMTPNHASTAAGAGTTFANPIKFSSVSEVVNALLGNLKGLIVTVAILFIVIGGVMYILSAGDEKKITTAKSTITAAVIGLAIALAAPTFLVEIENILGGANGVDNSSLSGALSLNKIITNILNLLLSVVGILAIIGLIVGGSFYLTSYGDEKRIETGKKIITSSLIGIVVVMAALVIVKQVAALFGVQ
jgi:hypothetical protein